jgi:organic radical activating enzyme
MKPVLPFVETMVTQACNLSCEGCTNYSDYNVNDSVQWSTAKEWISAWLNRMDIPDFGLIGGEPLLNKDITQWLIGCRELMPLTQIRFTTNGTILSQKAKILDTIFDIGNCVFKISVHQPDQFYIQEALNRVFSYTDWEPVTEFGIQRWRAENNVRFQVNFPKTFYKSFKGNYSNMLPHNSNPVDAFEVCCQKTCPLLYNGRIYKCSSIALLDKTLTDWKQHQPEWGPYLNYKGIGVDCTDEELTTFINSFGKPEDICRMCPGVDESRLDHINTVTSKTNWIKINAIN